MCDWWGVKPGEGTAQTSGTDSKYPGGLSPWIWYSVAVGSGTALIFLQATYEEWFSIKMVLVGIMAMLHVVAGLVVHVLF